MVLDACQCYPRLNENKIQGYVWGVSAGEACVKYCQKDTCTKASHDGRLQKRQRTSFQEGRITAGH